MAQFEKLNHNYVFFLRNLLYLFYNFEHRLYVAALENAYKLRNSSYVLLVAINTIINTG